jgi:hypothetical protein
MPDLTAGGRCKTRTAPVIDRLQPVTDPPRQYDPPRQQGCSALEAKVP